MTENEYNTVTDLERIRVSINSLRNIIPSIVGIINDEDHKLMLEQLTYWETKYYKKLEDTYKNEG